MTETNSTFADNSEFFRAYFEKTSDAILLLENGVFTDCNAATVKMMRAKNKAEFLSLHPSKVSPEFQADGRASAEKADEMIRIALEKGNNRFEWTHRRVDGEDFPVEVLLTPITLGGRDVIHTVWRDISRRKQVEAGLLRLQSAVEQTGEGIAITDMEGNMLYANPAWADMHGYTLDEIQGKHLSIFHTEEQIKRDVIPFNEQVMAVGRNSGEVGHVRKDGTTFPTFMTSTIRVDEKGKHVGLIGTARDITEQKQAEEALRAERDFGKTLVEASPAFLVTINGDGSIRSMNQAMLDATGYSLEEVVGKDYLSTVVSEEERPTLAGVFAQLTQLREPTLNQNNVLTKDGRLILVEWRGRPVLKSNGEFDYFFGLGLDITERFKAEQVIRENEQRFRTVADFAYDWESWLAPDGKYTYVSPSCERISGYRSEEFMQNPALFSGLVYDEDRAKWDEHIRVYHGAHSLATGEMNLRIIARDGQMHWLGHICRAVHDDQGKWLGRRASNRDITEQIKLEKATEESLKRRERQVGVSTQVSQYIAAAADLNDLYQRVVTQVKEQFGYYHTQLLQYDEVQNAVVLITGYGEVGRKMLGAGHRMELGVGLIGTAAATGEAILRPNLAHDPDWKPNPLLPDTKGEVAVPIKLGEQILGVLDIQSDTADALDAEDQIALEGLCGQIAIAIENTRLRQETNERIEEVNRLYRAVSREGWQSYRQTGNLPQGFMFDQTGIIPVQEEEPLPEKLVDLPITAPGGEVVGTLSIPQDPQNPLSDEDQTLLNQITDQIALALESARLFDQTQSALAQTEKLSAAGLRFSRAAGLQELLGVVNETLSISGVNRMLLGVFNYNSARELESMDIVANWWSGSGHQPSEVGRHYTPQTLNILPLFISTTPVFFNDAFHDERINETTKAIFINQNIHSMAVLPLYLGDRQIGVLFLESEGILNFTQDETRLFAAMAPQIATVLENRRQFERAQKQAEREAMLNLISQKIQSATSVEAVLQIAARELGHALGAPITVAQLSMKDK